MITTTKSPSAALRAELLQRITGVRPDKVLVIDTFRCGHPRAYNTVIDANGQARCVRCRRARASKP